MFQPKFMVIFYQELTERQPVNEWIKKLDRHEQETITQDLKTLQLRWPMGLPLVKALGSGFWELRSTFKTRIARSIFIVIQGHIIILHSFIKKTQKIPPNEMAIARKRLKALNDGRGTAYA